MHANSSEMATLRTRKQLVGVIAIAAILTFTVLALAGIFSFLEWIIGDLIVALIANLILRRLGKQK